MEVLAAQTYEFQVDLKEVSPLLVFVNSTSGGQLGTALLDDFRSWLNPLQVRLPSQLKRWMYPSS